MIDLLKSIPAHVRQSIYFGWVGTMFLLGGIDVGLAAAGVAEDPTWFVVLSEVLKYAGVPILAVAGVNVTVKAKDKLSNRKWPPAPGLEPDAERQEYQGRHESRPKLKPGAPVRIPPAR